MKFFVTIIASVFLSAVNADAVTNSSIHGHGAICKTASSALICFRSDGRGYGMGISDQFVFVQDSRTHKIIFQRWQP